MNMISIPSAFHRSRHPSTGGTVADSTKTTTSQSSLSSTQTTANRCLSALYPGLVVGSFDHLASTSLGKSLGTSLSRNNMLYDYYAMSFGNDNGQSGSASTIGSPATDLAAFACLEDRFCKNFSCCGLELDDLHALLQHFEECHGDVRLDSEEDEELFEFEFMDEGSEEASESGASPLTFTDIYFKASSLSSSFHSSPGRHSSNSMLMMEQTQQQSKAPPAAVALSDIYAAPSMGQTHSSTALVSGHHTPVTTPTRKSNATTHSSSSLTGTTTKPSQQSTGEQQFLKSSSIQRHQGNSKQLVLEESIDDDDEMMMDIDTEPVSPVSSIGLSRSSSFSLIDDKDDRPYKCKMKGCSKAYKNPGGLKYHMQHGHCQDTGDPEMNNIIHKPYQCTVPDCGRRYKNLNGLKYHIEHSHVTMIQPTG